MSDREDERRSAPGTPVRTYDSATNTTRFTECCRVAVSDVASRCVHCHSPIEGHRR